ncbi:MAG: helix-turn-helix domain-containing protein [Phycisphaerae bacterium]|nr:helix-turn-helix domain-containing protein [Phycisphaerae bacterium]
MNDARSTGTGTNDATLNSGAAPMLVDRREAARLLGVSPGTIDNLRNAGGLPSLKLMSRRLYDVRDLVRFIDCQKDCEVGGNGPVPTNNGGVA